MRPHGGDIAGGCGTLHFLTSLCSRRACVLRLWSDRTEPGPRYVSTLHDSYDVIQALPTGRADQPLRMTILPG
jgi:hypothetical protein